MPGRFERIELMYVRVDCMRQAVESKYATRDKSGTLKLNELKEANAKLLVSKSTGGQLNVCFVVVHVYLILAWARSLCLDRKTLKGLTH